MILKILSEKIITSAENKKRNWASIPLQYVVPENILEKYAEKWDCDTVTDSLLRSEVNGWYYISKFQTLSEDFILKYQHKLNMKLISRYQKLSMKFIEENLEKLNLTFLFSGQKLSDEFFQKHYKKITVNALTLMKYPNINWLNERLLSKMFIKNPQYLLNINLKHLPLDLVKKIMESYKTIYRPISLNTLIENYNVNEEFIIYYFNDNNYHSGDFKIILKSFPIDFIYKNWLTLMSHNGELQETNLKILMEYYPNNKTAKLIEDNFKLIKVLTIV